MGALIERTRYIRLGSGVTSLPYHHPLMVANRFVQLDHMSRGRTMLGCGPGALPSDAYMMGIEPSTQRARMEQSLSAIMQLLKCEEPVTMKTDWFELKQARLHLAPYSFPHFPIACASTITPSGMIAAGKHGLGVLSIGAGLPGGPEAMAKQWAIYEGTAAQPGHKADRSKWRIGGNRQIAGAHGQGPPEGRGGTDGRGGEEGVHGRRPRGAGRIPPAHRRRAGCLGRLICWGRATPVARLVFNHDRTTGVARPQPKTSSWFPARHRSPGSTSGPVRPWTWPGCPFWSGFRRRA